MSTLAPKDADWATKGVYRKFNQNEFIDAGWFATTGLQKYGYIFYPESCLEKSCHIHFHLHGCGGMGDWIGYYFQFGDYAVSNDIIMVYPQIKKNMQCHDTFGYTGDNFATNEGIQPKFYQGVIDRLTQQRDDAFDYTSYNILK